MEALIEKYGFNDEQVSDIRKLVVDSFQEMLPIFMKDAMPTLTENFMRKVKSDSEAIEDMSRKRKTALKYVQDHLQEWEWVLKKRNQKYWQYIRCVSELDLCTECLEGLDENDDTMYIPRKFRRDKTHYRDATEKREIERMNHERMKSHMQILAIRKESFMREIEQTKKEDEEYFRKEIEDDEVLENVLEIWYKSMKKDEESSNDKCTKNREAMRTKYEKDKEESRRKERNSSNLQNPSQPETRVSAIPAISTTDNDSVDAETSEIEARTSPSINQADDNNDEGRTSSTSQQRRVARENSNINNNRNSNSRREENGRDTFFGGRFNNKNSNFPSSKNCWEGRGREPPNRNYNLRSSTYLHSLSASTT